MMRQHRNTSHVVCRQAPAALQAMRDKEKSRKQDWRARRAELNAQISEAPEGASKGLNCLRRDRERVARQENNSDVIW